MPIYMYIFTDQVIRKITVNMFMKTTFFRVDGPFLFLVKVSVSADCRLTWEERMRQRASCIQLQSW